MIRIKLKLSGGSGEERLEVIVRLQLKGTKEQQLVQEGRCKRDGDVRKIG